MNKSFQFIIIILFIIILPNTSISGGEFKSAADWEGTYDGSLDGRKAKLVIQYIPQDVNNTLHIDLQDLDSNKRYVGIVSIQNINIIQDLVLRSKDGRKKTLINRLHLHRDNTDYISGYSIRLGNEYGILFIKSGEVVDADEVMVDADMDDLFEDKEVLDDYSETVIEEEPPAADEPTLGETVDSIIDLFEKKE